MKSLDDALTLILERARIIHDVAQTAPSAQMTVHLKPSSKLKLAMFAGKEFCKRKLSIEDPICSVAAYLHTECKLIGGNLEAIQFIVHNSSHFDLDRVQYVQCQSGFVNTNRMRQTSKKLGEMANQKISLLESQFK